MYSTLIYLRRLLVVLVKNILKKLINISNKLQLTMKFIFKYFFREGIYLYYL